MNLTKNIIALTLATLLGATSLTVTAATPNKLGAGKTAPAAQNRLVIQINEDNSKKWHEVLVNIKNIQAELGPKNVAIALVAIGPGLGMLTAESLAANGVQDAIAAGVEFVACGNSMKGQKLTKDDLVEGISVSVAGYVELMQRQQQGWAYLRP
jgi:intracellular sulfur oxidation DsrE/DsrF family protein